MSAEAPFFYTMPAAPLDLAEAITETHSQLLRVVADLHAAYGAGVIMEVQEAGGMDSECRNLLLSDGVPTDEGGNAVVVGFWPEGEMTVASYHAGVMFPAVVALDAILVLLDNLRAFLHTYGSGPR